MDAPKLEILTGPLKSSTFLLPTGDFTIGRGDENTLKIPHTSVSRNHCVFQRENDGSISIRDLGSRNGTLVNGAQITQDRQLNPGDEIQVGTSLFILTWQAPQPESLGVSGEGSRFLTRDTILAAPVTAQIVRLLDALLKTSLALGDARTFLEWEQLLLDSIFTLTSAAGAAVAAPDGRAFSFERSLEGRNRESRESRCSVALDPTVVDRAIALNLTLREQVGDWAVIAAPIRANQRTGLLYLAGEAFSDDELHAVAAVAAIGGMAWERVARAIQLEGENQRLWRKIEHKLVGESASVRKLVEFISKVAVVSTNVLLLGESGTGKELVAMAIHRNSARASQPYITINCGAFPPSLIESELFGAERGAFTGAETTRKGLFECAAGGTVLLDEISELPLDLQPALLRVLQNRELRRLGGTRTIPVDFRLIAASNRDLKGMVQQGTFRPDLYHRLSVITQTIPALRDHPADIPLLAHHFLRNFAERSRPACEGISEAALSVLSRYLWPGNVRELENAIERAVVMGDSAMIELDDLPESILESVEPDSQSGQFHIIVANAKRRAIKDALRSGGTFVQAARILGVNPNYLHRLVKNLGLRSALDDTSGSRLADPDSDIGNLHG